VPIGGRESFKRQEQFANSPSARTNVRAIAEGLTADWIIASGAFAVFSLSLRARYGYGGPPGGPQGRDSVGA